jgi:hypothetical protein
MKKIPSLFARDMSTGRVTDAITPGCEWALTDPSAVPTVKWDGTACLVRGGKLFKRYDSKRGKAPPPNFEPCQDPDPITGHHPGWIPVSDAPDDRWHREVVVSAESLPDGTYELVHPKVNGNPHRVFDPCLVPHGADVLENARVLDSFAAVRDYLAGSTFEGIVWHHPDGRMTKAKRVDFGFPWGSHHGAGIVGEEPEPLKPTEWIRIHQRLTGASEQEALGKALVQCAERTRAECLAPRSGSEG